MKEILKELIIFIKAICLSVSVFVILKIVFGLAEWVLGL
jgi:hypothetical protein